MAADSKGSLPSKAADIQPDRGGEEMTDRRASLAIGLQLLQDARNKAEEKSCGSSDDSYLCSVSLSEGTYSVDIDLDIDNLFTDENRGDSGGESDGSE